MDSNITDQTFFRNEAQLAEPHFDEESTLLSARPVVPLEKVTATGRLTRPWLFGLALAGALLLGVSATAFYYSRLNMNEPRPQASAQTSSRDAQATSPGESLGDTYKAPVIAGGAAADSDRADTSTRVEPRAPSSPAASSTTSRNTAAGVSKKQSGLPATTAERSNRDSENREELRAARREARQRNRQLQREQRARTSDDLLRIREIFEGPSRP